MHVLELRQLLLHASQLLLLLLQHVLLLRHLVLEGCIRCCGLLLTPAGTALMKKFVLQHVSCFRCMLLPTNHSYSDRAL
jgi:hypothetical protein